MKWLVVLLILPTSSFACKLDLKIGDKAYKVCNKADRIFTKDCESVAHCFKKIKKLKFSSNQSPLFSLCYQSGATPRFAKIQGQKNKVEVCIKDGSKIVDLNSLMQYHNQK